jgi:hypothetical protein
MKNVFYCGRKMDSNTPPKRRRCKLHPDYDYRTRKRPAHPCPACLELYHIEMGNEEEEHVWEGWDDPLMVISL